MLEYFAIWYLARRIGDMVQRKGHKRRRYEFLVVLLWFGGELAGVVVGLYLGMASGWSDSGLFILLVAAYGGAALGAAIAYRIADGLAVASPLPSPAHSVPEQEKHSLDS
jgi:hypothetical protein